MPVPACPLTSPKRTDEDFDMWLSDTLEKERIALVASLQQSLAQHLERHRFALLAEVDSHLDSGSATVPDVDVGKKERMSVEKMRSIKKGSALTSDSAAAAHLAEFADEKQRRDVQILYTGAATTTETGGSSAALDTRAPKSRRAGRADAKWSPPKVIDIAPAVLNRAYNTLRLRQLSHAVPDHNAISRIVFSLKFELVSLAVIVLNTVAMALEVQHWGVDVGHSMAFPGYHASADEKFPGAGESFRVAELIFTSLFAIELIFRLLAERLHAFRNAWIWLDCVLVLLGIVDVLAISHAGFNPTMVRMARLARVMRLVRIFSNVKLLDSLFLLMKSLKASMHALIWSFVVLFVIFVIVGLFVNQVLASYLEDEKIDVNRRREVFKLFGTFSQILITMFEISLANWVPPVRILIDNVSEWYGLFFVFYRCCFCFAIVNVISAVFIAETNRMATSDDEVQMHDKRRGADILAAKVKDVFDELDSDHDGNLTWNEFKVLLDDTVLIQLMTTMDLDVLDLAQLFVLLDDGDGQIEQYEFLRGVKMLKGSAKSIDLVTLLKDLRTVELKLDHLSEKLGHGG